MLQGRDLDGLRRDTQRADSATAAAQVASSHAPVARSRSPRAGRRNVSEPRQAGIKHGRSSDVGSLGLSPAAVAQPAQAAAPTAAAPWALAPSSGGSDPTAPRRARFEAGPAATVRGFHFNKHLLHPGPAAQAAASTGRGFHVNAHLLRDPPHPDPAQRRSLAPLGGKRTRPAVDSIVRLPQAAAPTAAAGGGPGAMAAAAAAHGAVAPSSGVSSAPSGRGATPSPAQQASDGSGAPWWMRLTAGAAAAARGFDECLKQDQPDPPERRSLAKSIREQVRSVFRRSRR